MALFTDASIVTLDDLLPFELSLAQVAATHSINVDTKISLATTNIGNKLLNWLLSVGASDPQWLTRPVIGLSTVVVTPALHNWICFEALSRFFAEAYNVQLNTRFQGKWTEYQKESDNAADFFFMVGAAGVYSPLPRPELPLVSVQAGTSAEQAIFIQTSWVDGKGNEGAVSPVNGQILSGASSIAVAMAEGAVGAPTAAAGWNVYAGGNANAISLQNATPVSIGSTLQLPTSGLIAGTSPNQGQKPDYRVYLSRQIRRG